MNDWRTIDTIPDFGYFIGFCPLLNGEYIVAPIYTFHGKASFTDGTKNKPTHWMFYPQPPSNP